MSRELLLVYTVGKVASTTISESLLEQGVTCYDVHNLVESNILRALKASADAGVLPPAHIGTSAAIYHDVKNASNKIKIICCFRDSLNRNISAIFQNLPRNQSLTMEDIRQRIEVTNPDKTGAWMRKEFIHATGINLIEAGFDAAARFGRFSSGRFDILMLRTDLCDSQKEQLISEFVGKEIRLNRKNEGGDKWYADLYEQFKLEGKISSAWIDECLNSAFMKTFYTEDEQQKFALQAQQWRD